MLYFLAPSAPRSASRVPPAAAFGEKEGSPGRPSSPSHSSAERPWPGPRWEKTPAVLGAGAGGEGAWRDRGSRDSGAGGSSAGRRLLPGHSQPARGQRPAPPRFPSARKDFGPARVNLGLVSVCSTPSEPKNPEPMPFTAPSSCRLLKKDFCFSKGTLGDEFLVLLFRTSDSIQLCSATAGCCSNRGRWLCKHIRGDG